MLTRKLKLLKTKLKVWNRTMFGNVHEKVIMARDNPAWTKQGLTMKDAAFGGNASKS